MALSYILNSKPQDKKMKYYNQDELELMTTYQLREICKEEKIINAITSPLDKDELIYQIMRFRGLDQNFFINKHSEEGLDRLDEMLNTARICFYNKNIRGCAKLICYKDLATNFFDNFTIAFDLSLANTNAILVSGNEICAIFQILKKDNDDDNLYITKFEGTICKESNTRNYALYCMDKSTSNLIFDIYNEEFPVLPEHLDFCLVEVLNFEIRNLLNTKMPLAIDFGTSNTTAGLYLDDAYFEQIVGDPIENILIKNDVNYLYHIDTNGQTVPTLPTVVGIKNVIDNEIEYVFGYEANRIFDISHMNDSFCVFYDIKRFVTDPEKLEEVVDKNGHRTFVARKEIIKVYLQHIISIAKQRYKCDITYLHISAPVKQKFIFNKLFNDILSDYTLEVENMLDEGVAVLYNSISDIISRNKFEQGVEYKALIIDCGGGTTDLSSCNFSIETKRVSYKINIETSYENGDTDFGGNNLTYRIMQLIKISLAYQYDSQNFMPIEQLMSTFDIDLFREVDKNSSIEKIYSVLDEEYEKAETIIPTKFKQYEHKSRTDYYAVKNNFYYIFSMAEKTKKEFYKKTGVLRIALSTTPIVEIATTNILVNRWNLFVLENNILKVKKDISPIYISVYELGLLLKADIYWIIKKFIGSLYEDERLSEYVILRLTGQSCKIDIFREALKEFIPGRMIESTKKSDDTDSVYALKLICLNGAIKYLKDTKFGFADVQISSNKSSFPYIISAVTHENDEKVLINGLNREKTYGFISRNMANVTLKLLLRDPYGNLRYTYSYNAMLSNFNNTVADSIVEKYKEIVQDDLDDIVDNEMKFFVISKESDWGFLIVPIYRIEGDLHLCEAKFFSFETDGWLTNFFDGTR